MTTQNINTSRIFSPDIVYSIMIIALFIILVIQIYTYFNFKYQINKLSLLFGDFTRFYIHASKPPYRNSSNFEMLNYANDKDMSRSGSSSESKSCQTENKINVVNEINDTKTNFKSKFRKFKHFPTPDSRAINKSTFVPNTSIYLSANKPKYLRRHSTFDLINHLGDGNSQEKCPNLKFRHSESYSFDLANKIYTQFTDNHHKFNVMINTNKAQVQPQRRPRLYGVSDDFTNGRKYLDSITSTSTPNR